MPAFAVEEAAAVEHQRIGLHIGLDFAKLARRRGIGQRPSGMAQADEERHAVPCSAGPVEQALHLAPVHVVADQMGVARLQGNDLVAGNTH